MSILDKKHILTISLDTRAIEFKEKIKFYNTDRNIANLYVRLKKKNEDDVDIELKTIDLNGLTLKLTVVKPKTIQTREMVGALTDELGYDYAVYKFELPLEFTDQVGLVVGEFELTDNKENGEVVTIDPFSYEIKASKLTGLNAEIIANPDLPILKSLMQDVKETMIELTKEVQKVNYIDNVNITDVNTYSNKKIEEKFSGVAAQFQTKANQSDLNFEKTRLDNLIVNNNPTDGNSELIDARVGADGKIYNNLGNAMRGQIGSITETITSINVFDTSKIINGKNYNVYESGGRIWNSDLNTNTNCFVTNLIKVNEGDIIKSNKSWLNMVYYMADKTTKANDNLTNFGNLNKNQFTVNSTVGKEIRYVAMTYLLSNLNEIMITVNNEIPSNYSPYFETVFAIKESAFLPIMNKLITKNEIKLTDKWVRKDVYINLTDTQEEILVKMLNAVNTKNCDVYFETGTYNFNIIFDLMKSKYGYTTAYELPVGGNCRYYFNGSTLIATSVTTDNGVLGNQSLIGSRRNSGNYELHDGALIANDMVYIVHDEAQGSPIPYIRKYKNMKMKYNTISSTQEYRKCIGGGAGLKGTIIIENCIFESDYTSEVSYHGFQSDKQVELNVTISNCYFRNKVQFDSMYTNGKGVVLIGGCSFGQKPVVGTNWTIFETNNTVRV